MKHTLTIAFSANYPGHEGFFSKLIRFFDRPTWQDKASTFSHALGIIDGELVTQAVGHGVSNLSLEDFLKERKIVEAFKMEISPETASELRAYAEGSEHKLYSWSQLLGILLRKWLHMEWTFSNNGTKFYICSEYAGDLAEFAKPLNSSKIKFHRDLDWTTPRELRDMVANNPLFNKIIGINQLNLGSTLELQS